MSMKTVIAGIHEIVRTGLRPVLGKTSDTERAIRTKRDPRYCAFMAGSNLPKSRHRAARCIVACYIPLASAWLFISDVLAVRYRSMAVDFTLDAVFVIITGFLLHRQIRAHFNKQLLLQDTLLKNEERLSLALSAARMGIWEWDVRTHSVYWSPECFELTGAGREGFKGELDDFLNVVHPEDREMVMDVAFGPLDEKKNFSVEYRIIRPDGEIRRLFAHARWIFNEQGERLVLVGTKQDVTELRRIEEALQRSEKLYRAVVEDQTEVISRFLPDGTFTYVNDVYCRLFGKTREELVGCKWHPAALSEDLPMIEAELRKMSPHEPVVVIENRAHVASGDIRWMQFVNRGFYDDQGGLVEIQSVGRDITPLKETEKALHGYIRRLNELEERLRKKIAAELHDEVGRDLTALSINLSLVGSSMPRDTADSITDKLWESRRLLEDVSRPVRNIMAGLRPPMLDEHGLAATLRWEGDMFSGSTGIAVTVHIEDAMPRLAGEKEMALFRIVQEALANVRKHAAAGNIVITYGHRGEKVRLSVIDDGNGISAMQTDGITFGMAIMRERAEALGGRLIVNSIPLEGTMIIVEIPKEG